MRQILFLLFLGLLVSCFGTKKSAKMEPRDQEDFYISELKFNIKNDPANPVGYVSLGKAYAKMDKYQEALAQFERAYDLSPEYNNAFPSCSPENLKLVVQSNRDGNWEIYLIDLGQGIQKRLTNNQARDESPVFAPDGSQIAFTSTRDDAIHTRLEEMQREIYLTDIGGEQQMRITESPHDDWAPSFAPSGEAIIFSSDRDDRRGVPVNERWSNLYKINLTSRELQGITNSSGNDVCGCFSPDGTLIYFHSNRSGTYQIYCIDLTMPVNSAELCQLFE